MVIFWRGSRLFPSPWELFFASSTWFGPYYEDLEDEGRQRCEINVVLKPLLLILAAIALIWGELELLLHFGLAG